MAIAPLWRRRTLAHALALLPIAGVCAEQQVAESYWVPRAALTHAQLAGLPEYCAGAYVTPRFPHPRDVDDAEFPVEAEADRAEYWVDGEVVLSGSVEIVQGNRSLHTERAALDRNTRDLNLSDRSRVVDPLAVVEGSEAQMNIDTKALTLEEVEFLLLDAEMRGTARRLERDEQGTIRVRRSAFTRCEPGDNGWRISSSRLTVKEDSVFATARNAVVRFKGVPVLYTPYIRFPVSDKRQSGFLFPDLGYSSEDGVDVALPYYLNLAPNYDATVVPRHLGGRGTGLELEFRHLARWENTTLSGAFLPKDDRFNGELDRDDFEELSSLGLVTGEFEPADRWLYGMFHQGRLGRLRTYVDYTAVSDREYFRDLGTDLAVSSRIDLERRGEVSYSRGGFSARLWAQRFQRLDEITVDAYQRLPELELNFSGELLGLQWSLGADWVTFTRNNDDLLGSSAAVVGDRLHLEPRLTLPLARPWGFLTLSGGYRYTEYDLNDVPTGTEARPDRGIAFGSLGAGLFFERDLNWFDTPLVQTLEPRVFYLYQEFEDQSTLPLFDTSTLTFGYGQLFRDNRFSGLDRMGDANQASVGVTSRFINADTGREYFRASVGEIFYFRDREVTLGGLPTDDDRHGTSALAGELSWSITPSLRLTGTVIWDPNDNEVDEGAASLQLYVDRRRLINLGYRNRRDSDIDQTDVSLYWPLTRRFSLIGRWNYDLVSGRTIEGLGGIEYNDCCWQVRLVARRFIDSPSAQNLDFVDADEGIFLQIVLRGLAGFGGRLESVLERGIYGYRPETDHGF